MTHSCNRSPVKVFDMVKKSRVHSLGRVLGSWRTSLMVGAQLVCVLTGCNKQEPAGASGAQEAVGVASIQPASGAASAKVEPAPPAPGSGEPLRIAYSDWPGWVAWEIAIQQKWFEESGLSVNFSWFEYVPSMEAFSAGKVDAVTMTNGDALVTGSSGAASKCIVINDYSNGNDMIVAQPGIKSLAELKGKKLGVEVGFVAHLLLLKGLESAGLTEQDVELLNVPTDQTPQTLKSGSVAAIAAWQPNSGQALKEVPGSTAIFTSANVPGLIYDLLCVNPQSLAERRAEWGKVVAVWFRIADYLRDPKNLDEAARIMAARVGLAAEAYKPLMKGTQILGLAENLQRFAEAEGFQSVYGSSQIVDAFNVKNGVYKAAIRYQDYLDPSLVQAAAKGTAGGG